MAVQLRPAGRKQIQIHHYKIQIHRNKIKAGRNKIKAQRKEIQIRFPSADPYLSVA
jgi:hypothetical protein